MGESFFYDFKRKEDTFASMQSMLLAFCIVQRCCESFFGFAGFAAVRPRVRDLHAVVSIKSTEKTFECCVMANAARFKINISYFSQGNVLLCFPEPLSAIMLGGEMKS